MMVYRFEVKDFNTEISEGFRFFASLETAKKEKRKLTKNEVKMVSEIDTLVVKPGRKGLVEWLNNYASHPDLRPWYKH